MKNVIISIRGEQFDPEAGDSGLTQLVTDGQMDKRGGITLLTYREGAETGAPTLTTLMVDGGSVTLLRSGDVNTQMVFEKGRRHVTYYDTAEGSLTVGVVARQVEARLTGQGGRIKMVYNVEIDNTLAGENHVTIDIRPTPGAGPPRKPQPGGIFYDRYIH